MRVAGLWPLWLLVSASPAAAILEGQIADDASGIRRSVVAVESDKGDLCSGALLDSDLVLTAAHCVVARASYRVVALDLAFRRVYVAVAAAAVHPAFVPDSTPRTQTGVDLAVLKLSEPLADDFQPFPRPDSTAISKGQPVTIAGFGIAATDASAAGVLREKRLVNLGTLQVANRVMALADERHLGQVSGAGACRGDAGAPIYISAPDRPQLIGIVSWSSGPLTSSDKAPCGGLTAVTPLAGHTAWINARVADFRLSQPTQSTPDLRLPGRTSPRDQHQSGRRADTPRSPERAAAEITVEEKRSPPAVTIRLSGKIAPQDFHRLDSMIEQIEKRLPGAAITLVLNSSGGAHFAGLRAGLLVQRKGIGTQILPGATCLSACASIFFGGFNRQTGKPNRVVHEGARLGVHRMVHVSGPSSDAIERRVAAAAQSYLADVRISEKVRRMFLETPPDQIYILTAADLAESEVSFVRAR